MEVWKPAVLIVPAGLLLGVVVAHASKPEMLKKDERPWPESVADNAFAAEPWRPIRESGPQDLSPRGHSYRPALDFDAFVWPDQHDRSAELLAADYEFDSRQPLPAPDLPLTRRATVELAASRAQQVAGEAAAVAAADVSVVRAGPKETPEERAAIVLPPVPPLPLQTRGIPDIDEAEGEFAAVVQ